MSMSRDTMIRGFYAQCDIVSVIIAWLLAYYFRFYGPLSASKGIPEWHIYLKLTPFILLIWFFVLSFQGFYRKNYITRPVSLEAFAIIKACAIALTCFIVVSYFYDEYRYSRLTLAIFAVLHPMLIILNRSALRKFFKFYKRHNLPRKVLLIGAGSNLEKALSLTDSLDLTSVQIIGIVGVFQNSEEKNTLSSLCEKMKCSLFDIPEDWISFFLKYPCESVLVALPNHSHSFFSSHLESIVEQVPDIKIIPDLSYLDRFHSGMELVGDIPVMNIHDSPLKGMNSIIKRIFDIVGSLFCIVIFSPLLLVISFLVKWSSPGRIFYVQERMGLDGRTFPILKFRTMPENIEKETGAVWARKDDGRGTKIGSLLRKTSLDELPQLFNVLAGQMSLVGPRPERPIFVAQFRRSVPGYMLRHKVKAGMTGWAQVQGWRGNTSIEKRIEADLHYIQSWSLLLDIKILLLTLVKGFVNTNAY